MMRKTPEEKLKDAKRLLTLDLISQQEFDAIKKQCLFEMDLGPQPTSKVTSPIVVSSSIDALSFQRVLLQYAKEMTGDWLSQSSGRLLGFLLDYLSPKVESRTIKVFVGLSYEERLLYHLLHSDKISLQQHYSALCQTYHPNLVGLGFEVSGWNGLVEVLVLAPILFLVLQQVPHRFLHLLQLT